MDALEAVAVTLVDRVDPQLAGATVRRGWAALTDRGLHRTGLGDRAALALVGGAVAHRDPAAGTPLGDQPGNLLARRATDLGQVAQQQAACLAVQARVAEAA